MLSMYSAISRKYFNTPVCGLVIYEAINAVQGITILASRGISCCTNIADHVRARKPRKNNPDASEKILLMMKLLEMKRIAPAKTDAVTLTGSKIAFNRNRFDVGIVMLVHPFVD